MISFPDQSLAFLHLESTFMVALTHLLNAPAPLFLQLLTVVLRGVCLLLQLLQASCPLLLLPFLHKP